MNTLLKEPRSEIIDIPNHWELDSGRTHALEVLIWECDAGEGAEIPTAVCVHGLTRNAHDFMWLADSLSLTHRVIAISMAGRGNSPRLTDVFHYHYGTYVQDCLAVLQHIGAPRVDWVGTSMGGIIGMMIAATAPQSIRSLVINDIGAVVPANALQRIYNYASTPHLFATHEACANYLREVLTPWCIPSQAWHSVFHHSIIRLADGQFTPCCDPDILAAVKFTTEDFTKVEDVSLEEFWNKITCPTLLLHGLASDVLPADVAQSMAACAHVEYIPYAGIGHAPSLMDNEQIEAVCTWIRHASEKLL